MATIISTKTSGVGGLEVTGDATGVLQLASNNGTTAVTVDASQNVGIGTASPTTKLDVLGNIKINGSANTRGLYWSMYGQTNNAYLDIDGSVDGNTLRFGTNNAERMRIDSSGNVRITQSPGRYTVDTTGGATVISNGATIDFANASGMLIVNNYTSGAVTIWLCGGGNTNPIANVVGNVGTFTYVAGINGYRWTNNSGVTTSFGFFFARTRTGA